AHVAQRERPRQVPNHAVGLVDDQRRAIRPRAQGRARILAQSPVAMHRWFDHDAAPPYLAQRRLRRRLLPELAEGLEAFEILVAIQRDKTFPAGLALQKTA